MLQNFLLGHKSRDHLKARLRALSRINPKKFKADPDTKKEESMWKINTYTLWIYGAGKGILDKNRRSVKKKLQSVFVPALSRERSFRGLIFKYFIFSRIPTPHAIGTTGKRRNVQEHDSLRLIRLMKTREKLQGSRTGRFPARPNVVSAFLYSPRTFSPCYAGFYLILACCGTCEADRARNRAEGGWGSTFHIKINSTAWFLAQLQFLNSSQKCIFCGPIPPIVKTTFLLQLTSETETRSKDFKMELPS